MMSPKPRSAPGHLLQSRLAKNRTNAMKEIQTWAKRADDPASCYVTSRMSGLLTDNVTEERMLRAKLWELSKERYKFLIQNAYEKKIFADRMQRRSSAMRQRSRASSAALGLSRYGSSRPCSTSHSSAMSRNSPKHYVGTERDNETIPIQQCTLATHVMHNDHKVLQERLESPQSKDPGTKYDDYVQSKEGKRKVVMNRGKVTPAATSINIPSTDEGGARVILAPMSKGFASPAVLEKDDSAKSLSPFPKANSRNVKFSKGCVAKMEDSNRLSLPSHTVARGQTSSESVSVNVPSPGVLPTRPISGSLASNPNPAMSRPIKPWATTTATPVSTNIFGSKRGLYHRFGTRLESTTTDPRYASLEHCLIPVQKQRCQADVKTIVQSFDALHMQPRLRKEVKPKVELKALKYIDERGFVL